MTGTIGLDAASREIRDASKPSDTPGASQDVVQPEGSAATERQQADGQVEARLYRAGEPPRTVELDDLETLVALDENFVWIDLQGYIRDELEEVGAILDLHRVAVHAAMSPWQRPRIDVFGSQFFVSVTVPRLDPGARQVHASQLDLFVGRNYLASAHKLPLPFITRTQERASYDPELVQLDSAFMLYLILDELLSYYERLVEHVAAEIKSIEERALQDVSEAFLGDLLHFKRYLFGLDTLAGQHRSIFRVFLQPDFPFVSGERVEVYFRDLEGRFEALSGELTAARDAVNSAFDIYVSHVTFRTNHIIRILTVVSTVLLPVSVLVGFFGTGFRSVSVLYGSGAFVVMLLLIATVMGAALFAVTRRGWI